jgi:NADH-quinone oxidoreductase subunit C
MERDALIKHIQEKFAGKTELLETCKAEPGFLIKTEDLYEFSKAVRDDDALRIDYLCSISAIDTGERFEVVYSVASVKNRIRFDYKIIPDRENPEIDSVIDIWPGANWYEREVWELYGINVKNHPNLTRFLLPDDWDQGNPMRKDWDAPDFIRMPEK